MMGCKSCLWRLIKFTAVCLAITFIPGLPPHNVVYREHHVKRPQPLAPELAGQFHLNNAEHLFEGQLVGPEAFAVHNDVIYTGVHGGFVIRIDSEGISPVVKFGKNCDDLSEERICGRPLGMKFDKQGNLFVVDSYYGIFKYDMKQGTKTLLVDVSDEIEGKKSMFMNDLAVGSDGAVYFTVSSTSFPLEDGVQAMFTAGDGRLMKYDPKLRTTVVLAEDLYFPNGIVLSPQEDFLLFAETTHLRILKYNLKGAKKGTVEIFADGLPGAPDNIRSDGKNGYYVSLVVPADSTHPFLPQMLAPFPNIRRFISRLIALAELPFIQVNRIFPNIFCQKAIHAIGHFGPTRYLTPKTTTILQFDAEGNIKDAMLGNDGSISHVSDMAIVGDYIVLGSPYNNFIARVPLPTAPYRVTLKSVKYVDNNDEPANKAETKAKKASEEAKTKKAAEDARRAAEEAKVKKAAEDTKRAADEAKAKKVAEDARRAAEEAKVKKAADDAKRAADKAKANKAAEEARRAAEEAKVKKAADEAKAKKAAEDARRAAEEAKVKKAAEDAKRAADEAKARQAAAEVKAKKAAEDARRAAEEAKVKKVADEAKAKKAAEDAKKATEDAKTKKAAEEAKAQKASEEAKGKKGVEGGK